MLDLLFFRIEKNDNGTYTVHLDSKGKTTPVTAGVVMFGTGRKPNSRDIGLEVPFLPSACSFPLIKQVQARVNKVKLATVAEIS